MIMPFTEKQYQKYKKLGYFICKYCDRVIENPWSLKQKVCSRDACKRAHRYNIDLQYKSRLKTHAKHSMETARSFGNAG
jgi:hypothetical protein